MTTFRSEGANENESELKKKVIGHDIFPIYVNDPI
jgi:hypothetical protein